MTVFDVISDHKSRGDFEGAWQAGYAELEQDIGNVYLQTSLFWVIYAALKNLLEPLKSRDNKAPVPKEQRLIDHWALRFNLLQLKLPNELIDFRLWNLFRDSGKYCDPFCNFILTNGSAQFNQEDYKPFKTEKGESFSVVLRLARMVAANYLSKEDKSSLPYRRVIALIKHAFEKAQDSAKGKIWLEYDKARIYLAVKDMTRARDAFLTLLKDKRAESWAWFGLANTFEDEPKKAICLVSFGLTCADDPTFSIPGLVKLAELLAETGEHSYASMAIIKLSKIYSDNGWELKDSIVRLMARGWFDASLNVTGLDAHIKELAACANQYTMLEPIYYSGVIQSVDSSGKRAQIYISREHQLSARKAVFENRKIPNIGTAVRALCDMGSESRDVVLVQSIDVIDSSDISTFSGVLKIADKGFGFVNGDIFIPPGLIEGFDQNTEVTGVAIMAFDKVKNKYGLRAVCMLNALRQVTQTL